MYNTPEDTHFIDKQIEQNIEYDEVEEEELFEDTNGKNNPHNYLYLLISSL